jgi:hypothetical protein
MVLSDVVERVYAYPYYAEEFLGLYVLRGENMLLYGEWDDAKDRDYLSKESLVDYSPRLDGLAHEGRPHRVCSRGTSSTNTATTVHALPMVEGWKKEEDMTVLRLKLKERMEELKRIDKLKKQLKKEYGILEAEIMADFE